MYLIIDKKFKCLECLLQIQHCVFRSDNTKFSINLVRVILLIPYHFIKFEI